MFPTVSLTHPKILLFWGNSEGVYREMLSNVGITAAAGAAPRQSQHRTLIRHSQLSITEFRKGDGR